MASRDRLPLGDAEVGKGRNSDQLFFLIFTRVLGTDEMPVHSCQFFNHDFGGILDGYWEF